MKQWKQILALALAISMAATATACGGTTPAAPAPSVDPAPSGSTSTPAPALPSGKTLWFENGLEVTMMMPESNQQKMATDAPVIKAIKDATNVTLKLQPIPEADYSAKRATVFASNKMPDIVCNTDLNELAKYGSIGMFAAVSDYPEEAKDYLALINAPDRAMATKKRMVDGKTYDFRDLEYYRVPVASIGQIRIDLLEEQNIPMPTSWDELYDAMLKVKAKHPEMTGFGSRNSSTNYLLGQFAYPLGTGGYTGFDKEQGIYYEPVEDKYIYGPTDSRFPLVIEFMAKAYKDGLLDPDYAIMNKDQMFEKLSSGKMMFVYDNCSFTGRIYNPALKEISPTARFELVPPLKNSTGSTRAYRYEMDWGTGMAISSQSKNVADVMKFVNWMYTDEGRMITNFGVEGEHYNIVDGQPVIVDSIVEKAKASPDHFVGIQSELGVGLLAFAPYIDEATHRQVSDPIFIEFGDKLQKLTDEGKLDFVPGYPALTGDEAKMAIDLQTKLLNTFNQEIDAFITGKKPIAEWAKVVESLKAQGSQDLEAIYNTAYARLK